MRTRSTVLLCALLLAAGCDDGDTSGDGGNDVASSGGGSDGTAGEDASSGTSGGPGLGTTVVLRFGVSNGVRMGPTLVDPLVGAVWGDVYATADVTLTGPVDGAVAAASVMLDGVDLTTLDVSAESWVSEPLAPGSYTFLGMFDLDGNFAQTDEGPDAGDPVTLPNQEFDVVAGQETEFTVVFELVYG